MFAMDVPPRSFSCGTGSDDLVDGAVPPRQELVRVEHVVAADRLACLAGGVPLHDREAVLPADAARKTHDEGVRLRRDPADRAGPQMRTAIGALHLTDAVEDRADPVHASCSARPSPLVALARSPAERTRVKTRARRAFTAHRP